MHTTKAKLPPPTGNGITIW